MKIIQLPETLHEYLMHLIESHAARGVHPKEGLALYHLYDEVTNHAQSIPDEEIQRATNESIKQGIPECLACFEEDRSYTCIRPAHKDATAGN